MPHAFQKKTVAITNPADRTVFAFFGASSIAEVHCFRLFVCLVCSGAYIFCPRVRNGPKNLLIEFEHCKTLLRSCHTIAFAVDWEQLRYPSGSELLHSQNLYNIFSTRSREMLTASAIRRTVACRLSIYHTVVDFIDHFWYCNLFWTPRSLIFKNVLATVFKLWTA